MRNSIAMAVASDMLDLLDGPLAGAPVNGDETDAIDKGLNSSKSRWSSTSSAETDFNNYWHDSVCFSLPRRSPPGKTSSMTEQPLSYRTVRIY